MSGAIEQPRSRNSGRLYTQRAGRREVTKQALAQRNFFSLGSNHLGKTPHRDNAPAITVIAAGREKFPITEHIAGGGISKIIGGEREALNRQQNFAILK